MSTYLVDIQYLLSRHPVPEREIFLNVSFLKWLNIKCPTCNYFMWNSTSSVCSLVKIPAGLGNNLSPAPVPNSKNYCGKVIARPVSVYNFANSIDGEVMTAADCDFSGKVIGGVIFNYVTLCGANCAGNSTCDHFTYNPTTTTCWLKTPFPAGSNVTATISTGASCGYVTTRLISG